MADASSGVIGANCAYRKKSDETKHDSMWKPSQMEREGTKKHEDMIYAGDLGDLISKRVNVTGEFWYFSSTE